ncbi:FHA domain-containing protein [Ideonella sp. BN130291]|uniref:FHA domain-containing protein n=1 Tax=Ideonella sp. BN130291 TaxID=3112940 RepID=UPI002E2678C1|nr:FHA domain-containing protein [Ideonella sp. BN130291]
MTDATTAVWCLRFLSGPVKGRTLSLKRGANVIGSAGDCDVMLPGSEVQPRHLVVHVGELAVTVQRVAAADARLNGEPVEAQRRSVVAGDVVTVGPIDFQLERSYPAPAHDDSMFAESIMPGDAPAPAAAPPAAPRATGRWAGAALLVGAALGLLGMTAWDGVAAPSPAASGVNLAAVEKALQGFSEVEVIAQPGGQFGVRGYVESRARRQALQAAVEPFGRRVTVNVQAADEIIEQARRYVGDASVAIGYEGRGRLVVSGVADDESLRQKIRRLGEDLHPTVLVSDRVQYRSKPQGERDAALRDQWAAWQNLLPARLVSITEDSNGTRHIQLANGSRYYEGAVLRSGAELKHIDADGLELSGGAPEKRR